MFKSPRLRELQERILHTNAPGFIMTIRLDYFALAEKDEKDRLVRENKGVISKVLPITIDELFDKYGIEQQLDEVDVIGQFTDWLRIQGCTLEYNEFEVIIRNISSDYITLDDKYQIEIKIRDQKEKIHADEYRR